MVRTMTAVGGVLVALALWLAYRAAMMPNSYLPRTDPAYGAAEFAILQMRVEIYTLAAVVGLGGAGFIIGACIVLGMRGRDDGGNGG